MKIFTIIIIVVLIVFPFNLNFISAQQSRNIFYIATDGSDSNPGTFTKPFATLERARDIIREMKKSGSIPDGGITVYMRGGTYYINKTIVFGPEDSQPDYSPVTYCAYPGEKPIFSSGIKIKNWRRLDKEPAALPWEAHGNIWVADIPDLKYGKWRFYTLYDGDNRLPRARCEGFAPTKLFDSSVRTCLDSLYFPKGKIKNWSNLEDVEIIIRPKYPWVLNILGIKSVDEAKGFAITSIPGTHPLIQLGQIRDNEISCWVENVFEALNKPGEWILNTHEGRLYLWPKGNSPGNTIYAPCLRELIRVKGDEENENPVRNLIFKGLTFTHGDRDKWTEDDPELVNKWEMFDKDNALLRLRCAENITIRNCQFINSGGTAIRLDLYSQKNKIIDNYIAHMGGTGIFFGGYPGIKDVNKFNKIINNHIHHCGEIYWHNSGIFIHQSGENQIANNLIHHLPYSGINIGGTSPGSVKDRKPKWEKYLPTIQLNKIEDIKGLEERMPYLHSRNNIVENNEIYRVMEVMGDGNGIYLNRAGIGNIIRRNYVHHIFGDGSHTAIRTDDSALRNIITENIVFQCVMGGFTLKHFNHYENNIFVDILDEARSPNRTRFWGYFLLRGPGPGSRIQRNIFYHRGGEIPFYHERTMSGAPVSVSLEQLNIDNNIYYCAGDPQFSTDYVRKLKKRGIELHSISADPLFVNLQNGDFRLKPDSPAFKLGIKSIDVSKVGLQK